MKTTKRLVKVPIPGNPNLMQIVEMEEPIPSMQQPHQDGDVQEQLFDQMKLQNIGPRARGGNPLVMEEFTKEEKRKYDELERRQNALLSVLIRLPTEEQKKIIEFELGHIYRQKSKIYNEAKQRLDDEDEASFFTRMMGKDTSEAESPPPNLFDASDSPRNFSLPRSPNDNQPQPQPQYARRPGSFTKTMERPPKPAMPNVVPQKDSDDTGPETAPTSPYVSPSKRQRRTQAPPQQQQQPTVEDLKELETELDDITRRGLQPLHTFLGQVAVSMGMSSSISLYKWTDIPEGEKYSAVRKTSLVRFGARNIGELIRRNRHIGTDVLNLFMDAHPDVFGSRDARKQDVIDNIGHELNGCDFTDLPAYPDPTTVRGGLRLRQWLEKLIGTTEARMAPGWVWAVLPSTAFQFIVSGTCLGAITMAHAEVTNIPGKRRFTIKQLLCSGNVTSKFAEFCANIFMKRSGGNAYPSYLTAQASAGGGARRIFTVSAGYKHKKALASDMIGFRIWAQNIVQTTNPQIAEIRRQIAAAQRDLQNAQANLQRVQVQRPNAALPQINVQAAQAQLNRLQGFLDDYETHLPKTLRHIE